MSVTVLFGLLDIAVGVLAIAVACYQFLYYHSQLSTILIPPAIYIILQGFSTMKKEPDDVNHSNNLLFELFLAFIMYSLFSFAASLFDVSSIKTEEDLWHFHESKYFLDGEDIEI
ncbi:unnamed protein product [Nezara viridula]|uniref:Uncharacterized protein n=1 Tax=Nezara viridula TaxID=85310 RepID=A0A9P0E8P9_NEZVI|nr:unnamed protein product [Nezara viridula]